MEFEYFKNNGIGKEKIINEEKTVCNKLITNQIFRRSIGILKNNDCKKFAEWKYSCVCRGLVLYMLYTICKIRYNSYMIV